ncbi:MAG: class II aldolase/adducin family protein [Chloroflexi bacterium]|nr:class II aldolase/adducin family protein [Chloroflexota bacterium]
MNLLKRYQQLTLTVVRLINAPRKDNAKVRKALIPPKILQTFLECGQLVASRNLLMGVQIEMSVRLAGGKFLITKERSWFPRLDEQDLLVASLTKEAFGDHERLPARASWHRAIYQATQSGAVLSSNAPLAAAFASLEAGQDKEPAKRRHLLPAALVCIPPDAKLIASTARERPVFLIQDYGLLAVGDALHEAIAHAEMAVYWCQQTMFAQVIQYFGESSDA